MFPKTIRLQSKEIPRIARYGKKLSNEYFDIRVWWDDKLDSPKFAISISVKIDKRATVRNTIKRKLRAAVVEFVKENPSVRKGNYVFIVRSVGLKDLKSSEVKEIIGRLL